MNDPRIRISILILLAVAHGVASLQIVPILAVNTAFLCMSLKKSFLKGRKIIIISLAALGVFVLISWALVSDLSPFELGMGYLRWVSLAALTVVLVLSLNALEIVTSLVFFRLPVQIALAIGVGIRFLPLLTEEAARVRTVQRRRGLTLSRDSISKYGVVELLSRITAPFLVSVLRRIDSLVVSIEVQQLKHRALQHEFTPPVKRDWISLAVSGLLLVLSVLDITPLLMPIRG